MNTAPRDVARLIEAIRDLFGIVRPSEHMRISASTVAIAWPVGIDKRMADRRIGVLGYARRPDLEPDPYSSAFDLDPL